MLPILAGFPAHEWGVDLVLGPTPECLEGITRDDGYMQMAPGEFLALIDGVGRMHVTADRVTLQPDPGRTVHDMDYLVYGWAPRWIRVLRQEYTLHASAVVIGDGAMAVMGFSGAGKSTTVTALNRQGYGLIIDDIVPVDFVDDQPFVFGWQRPVHLMDDAAAHFDVPDTDRVGSLALSKVSTTIPWVDGARPLRVAVELMVDDAASDVACRPLSGAERVQAILNNSNSAGVSAADGRALTFFAWATRLASSIEVHRITRPPEGWHLDSVVAHIAEIIAANTHGSEQPS